MRFWRILVVSAGLMIALPHGAWGQYSKSVSITFFGNYTSQFGGGVFPSVLSDPAFIYQRPGKPDSLIAPQKDSVPIAPLSGNGFRMGVRISKQFNQQVAASIEIDYSRMFNQANASPAPFPLVDTAGALHYYNRYQRATLDINQINFTPSLRYLPWDSHFYVEGGVSIGFIIRQRATYSRIISGTFDDQQMHFSFNDTLPNSATSTHVGDTQLQLAAMLGAGFDIWIADDFSIDVGLKSRFALNRMFVNIDSRIAYTIEGTIGLVYRAW